MKKLTAAILAFIMILSLAACAEKPKESESAGTSQAAPSESPEEVVKIPEDEAWRQAEAGTLVSDPKTGYEKGENGIWYYSNYPNYKDFREDNEIKIAFICKFAGAWFSPKQESMGRKLRAEGYTFQFYDCNSDIQLFMDYVQNAINQEFDLVVLTPPNTTLLAEAISLLQEAGIAYMTTDDPGPDEYGFYAPHYGLDDYDLHYQMGKACGAALVERDYFGDIKADFSDLEVLICDVPTVESIHLRNQGFCDAIKEVCGIPESSIVWLDISAGDALQTKFGATLQNRKAEVKKWIISNGGGAAAMAISVAQELKMNMENIIWADCFSDASTMVLMRENDTLRNNCFGVGLVHATAGIGIANEIIDLMENGTPIPCFTTYELNVITGANVDAFYAENYQ